MKLIEKDIVLKFLEELKAKNNSEEEDLLKEALYDAANSTVDMIYVWIKNMPDYNIDEDDGR